MVKIGSPPPPKEDKREIPSIPRAEPRANRDKELLLECLWNLESIMGYKCLNGRGRHIGQRLQKLAAKLHQRLDKGGI
jgi:hypothetical protein